MGRYGIIFETDLTENELCDTIEDKLNSENKLLSTKIIATMDVK